MRKHNANALVGVEADGIVMIEDVTDGDGRMYRLEYRSTPDTHHAIAFCRWNPWGTLNGGEQYTVGHVDSDGFLCLGKAHTGKGLCDSPYDLEYVIARARFWTTAFSILKETGEFPQP